MAYQGLRATWPLGQAGLTGRTNLYTLAPDQLIVANNVVYDDGVIQKDGGAEKFNTVAIPNSPVLLTGGVHWDPVDANFAGGSQIFAMAEYAGPDQAQVAYLQANGTVLNVSGTFSRGGVPVFVEGGNETAGNAGYMFVFNGLDVPHEKNTTDLGFSAMTNLPTDWAAPNWPAFGVNHDNRLWGGGNNNDPHRLYYSAQGNHRDWTGTGSGSISIYPGEGDRLIGAVTFKGLLIVFKRQGIYYVDSRDPDPANWQVDRITRAVGLASPLAVASIGENDALVWMDTNGVMRLVQGVLEFGNVRSNRLLLDQDFDAYLRRTMNLARLDKVQGIYYPNKDQAMFAMTATGGSVNNRRIIIDFNRLPPRVSLADRDECEALFTRRTLDDLIYHPVIGGTQPFLFDIDRPARNNDGVAYTGTVQTPHTDLSFLDPEIGPRIKNGAFVEVMMQPGETADVDVYFDQVLTQTVPVVANRRARIDGGGQFVSLAVRNATLNQNFSPAAARFYFTLGAEARP